ncbi:unnamed protein product [Clavelina lepadiformis]|uniref:Glucosylceramidase n=1 Tax=Clavelina lepadiformis TaxID=159417 RepID=A0ABP0FC82_CLALP
MSYKVASALLIASLLVVGAICALLVVFLPDQQTEEKEPEPRNCSPKYFSYSSNVCVCNSTYCDVVPTIPTLNSGEAVSYTSSKAGKRFEKMEHSFQSESNTSPVSFSINSSTRYQTLKGFGGAFTDAAGINIFSLPTDAQEHLMRSYFSSDGIEYNVGRIPMGGCDFSTRPYTYNDDSPGDFEMKNFSLTLEDFVYKIPLIHRAVAMNARKMSFFASPWSAPSWMKKNNALWGGNGFLKGVAGDENHKAWALYFSRFIEEYERNGVQLWAVTAQNEPIDGFAKNFSFNCMGFTPEQQRDFIKMDLGPGLHSRGHDDVILMIGDDQRLVLPSWPQVVLSDPDAAKYISGIGVHWYMDWITDPNRLTKTHENFTDYFIFGTEACASAMPWVDPKVRLGHWESGQRYSEDILEDLNHWVTGWTDWNLALDMGGGPNWANNFVDSPIIVNKEKGEFYKQPMFYHMGHFSKFLGEGSIRIEVVGPPQDGDLKYAAFMDGNSIIFVVLNKSDSIIEAKITDKTLGFLDITIGRYSIQTYTWSR